jgi:hypothetical protein
MPVFVGPGSAPDGGFEGKSDRVGFPTATADPGSAVVGDMYVQTVGTGSTLKMYNGTVWSGVDSQCSPMSATGGTKDTSSRSGYNVHTFTGPGTLTIDSGTGDVE